jgi:hypothetical protein
VAKDWTDSRYLTPDMIQPEAFLGDHLRILREGEFMDDDMIRGACPAQVAIPWLPAMLGCQLRVLPDNVLGEEQGLSWEQALGIRLDRSSPWFGKYIEFLNALVQESRGTFPVSHSPELGPTDLQAVLRGHTDSIMDLTDEPEKSSLLLGELANVFQDFFTATWEHLPRFCDGYFDAQYSLWSPGPIVRMQEDATAAYSPALYRKHVQPADRAIARHFRSSFIHLHSTSMFLLDAFLEIEEIRLFEINIDVAGPTVAQMIPHFRKVQKAQRPLLIRGSFTREDLCLLMESVEARGLFLNIMVKDIAEMESLRPLVGM